MKKYILAKDLPDNPAGTSLSERIDMAAFETAGPIKTIFFKDSLQRAIETGWVKEVNERIGLMPENVRISGGLPVAKFVSKYSGELFTPEEITLMEKAINGELVEVDLQKFSRWLVGSRPNVAHTGMSHAELLEAFNNRGK